jgi:hypothetical protein
MLTPLLDLAGPALATTPPPISELPSLSSLPPRTRLEPVSSSRVSSFPVLFISLLSSSRSDLTPSICCALSLSPGAESLQYSYSFVDDVFSPEKEDLSTYYTKWGRVLVILDEVVAKLYGDRIHKCTPLSRSSQLHSLGRSDPEMAFSD